MSTAVPPSERAASASVRAAGGVPLSTARAAFLALLSRDLLVLRKNVGTFCLRTLAQPFMFVFVFAYLFPQIGGGIEFDGGASFATVLVPGLVAVAVVFQGIQAVALPLVQEFSYTKEIEDRVLSPLPVWAVGTAKIVSGAAQSIVAAAVVLPVVLLVHAPGAPPEVSAERWPLFLVVLLLSALVGSSLGLLVGTVFEPRTVPLLFSVIVLPITFLGCTYYPWAALESVRWVQVLVLANPLVYMSEGFRAALTPTVDSMPVPAVLAALLAGVAVLGAASLRSFHRRVVS
jgi:ABC-2 type transport system permease protein